MFVDLPPAPPAQVQCLAATAFHEARGESEAGQRAVIHVVLNRSRARNLTPCQVIRQPGQFHFRMRQSYSGPEWERLVRLARSPGRDPTLGAHYFHNRSVRPRWNYRVTTTIGNHTFYR